ncbi:MAG: GAF domain-containing protein [Deltaproteobacteria bacterium HGW-Deltaproteobacteria-19]|jgi:signal transduction protein with GAF and PtsI domain|nr:MAG: GAF domain-containing protein [Deltaproteobacteria bacterium HGW-Deltaproteobacteria-19]
MEKRIEIYYQGLYEAAAVLNSSREIRDILHSIVENVAKTVMAKGCSLMLLSRNKRVLSHVASYGLSEGYRTKGPVLADKSLAEALAGKVVNVLHAPEDDRIQYPEEARKEGIASILSVPMMLRNEIVGVIRVYTAEPRQFTIDDMYFIGAVANLGAIALENCKLYRALKKDYETFRREYFTHIGEDRAW